MKKRLSVCAALLCLVLASAATLAANAATPHITDAATYAAKLDLAPSLIAELTHEGQAAEYAEYAAGMRPSNVIVHVDGELNAVKKGTNEVIGTLPETYTVLRKLKKGGVLTVAYVHDSAAVAALGAWIAENDVYDIAVMASDAELVRAARTANEYIRGIVDYSQAKLPALGEVVKESNRSFAHIVALSREQATADAVYYLQARFKAVWTYAEITDAFDLYAAVSSGAYGIITQADTRQLYKLYDNYAKDSLARPFYNIGHRGLPISMPENTLECCVAAYEGGATAVEIDMKVSADNQIFIMHDNTLKNSTNGPDANPETMTMAQLRQYKVTKNSNGAVVGTPCAIPTLDEIFARFQNVDDCVLVCEIKTTKTSVIDLFAEKLREYDMYDKAVVIAFGQDMLLAMKQKIPEIPTAYLNGCSESTEVSYLQQLQKNNAICDAKCDHLYFEERNLKNRGYLCYSWTYDTPAQVKATASIGTVGITNNCADSLKGYQKRILPHAAYTVEEGTDLSAATFAANVQSYGRQSQEKQLSVFAYRRTGDTAQVILQSEQDGYILYSEPIAVSFTAKADDGAGDTGDDNTNDTENNGDGANDGAGDNAGDNSGAGDNNGAGCGGVAAASGSAAAVLLAGAAWLLVRKNKKAIKNRR